MKIEGQHRFAATPELVWDAVTDPQVLAKVLPGCEDFRQLGEGADGSREFEGKLKIKVGPVQGDFLGNVVLSDLDPPHSYRLKLKGKGAPGFVEGDGELALEADPAGGTLLKYTVDAKIGGRIATVGQRLLDSSSKVITRQALEGLEGQVDARIAAHDAGAAAEAAARAERQAEAAASEKAAEEREAELQAAAAREAEAAAARAQAAAAAEAAAAARIAAAAKAAEAELAREKASQSLSQSELAAKVAKGVAADLLPMPVRIVLVVAALVALVFVIRSCS